MSKKKFKETDCYIPVVWCGQSEKPPKEKKNDTYYYKTGTRVECIRRGFGAGTHTERNSKLPAKSLQKIKYIGEKHEKKFKKAGMDDTNALIKKMKKKTTNEKEKILKKILTKKDGTLDVRAYNSTILYLYRHGMGDVPACKKL